MTLGLALAVTACGNNAQTMETTGTTQQEAAAAEDTTAKSEGVMTYAEYNAAELDTEVVVETYIQAKQGWWENEGVGVATFYTQDGDGAYFLYNMPCSQEEYESLSVGTKIRVTGYKSEWAGEVEIIDASFEIEDGTYVAEPVDLSEELSSEDLILHQNIYFTASGLTVEPSIDADGNEVPFLYNWDGSGTQGSDLYFNVSKDGQTYTFTVESYLTGADTDVYKTVESLALGQEISVKGFMYWYEGMNPHIVSVQ